MRWAPAYVIAAVLIACGPAQRPAPPPVVKTTTVPSEAEQRAAQKRKTCRELAGKVSSALDAGELTAAATNVQQLREHGCEWTQPWQARLDQRKRAFLTAAPEPEDYTLVSPSFALCLQGNAKLSTSECAKLLADKCSHVAKEQPELPNTRALFRVTWSVVRSLGVTTDIWMAAQHCLVRLYDRKAASEAAVTQAKRWSVAGEFVALGDCLQQCSLTREARARIMAIDGERSTLQLVERTVARLEKLTATAIPPDKLAAARADLGELRTQINKLSRRFDAARPALMDRVMQIDKNLATNAAEGVRVAIDAELAELKEWMTQAEIALGRRRGRAKETPEHIAGEGMTHVRKIEALLLAHGSLLGDRRRAYQYRLRAVTRLWQGQTQRLQQLAARQKRAAGSVAGYCATRTALAAAKTPAERRTLTRQLARQQRALRRLGIPNPACL